MLGVLPYTIESSYNERTRASVLEGNNYQFDKGFRRFQFSNRNMYSASTASKRGGHDGRSHSTSLYDPILARS